MVVFTVTFLLGFHNEPYRSSRIIKKNSLKSLKKSLKPSFCAPGKTLPKKQSILSCEDGTYIKTKKKDISTCHIHYFLSPVHVIHISVACFGLIAKVCTKNETVAMKTVKLERNLRWVAFSLTHQICPPKTFVDITKWHQHNVKFHLSENPFDLFPQIHKADVFFCKSLHDTIPSSDFWFEEVTIGSTANVEEVGETDQWKGRRQSTISNEYIVTKLSAVPLPMHEECVKRKIFDLTQLSGSKGINNNNSEEDDVGEEVKPKRKHKTTNKNKKNSKSKHFDFNYKTLVTISGHKLLYDKRTWSGGNTTTNKAVKMLNVWLTSTNLISEQLRNEIIPFGIHIKNLVNIPRVDFLNLSEIKLKYSLGDLIKNIMISPSSDTTSKLNETVFDDVKMFFLSDVPLLKILENLQMNKLVVKVYAPKSSERQFLAEEKFPGWDNMNLAAQRFRIPIRIDDGKLEKKSTVKKTHENLKKMKRRKKHKSALQSTGEATVDEYSHRGSEGFSGFVLIGYAEIDCSSLATDAFRIDKNADIRQRCSQLDVLTNRVTQSYSLHRAHENVHKERSGKIENGMYVENKSHLQVSVRISGLPDNSSLERRELYTNIYKRIVIILKEKDIVTLLLKRIFRLNSSVLNYKDVDVPWVPYWFPRKISEDHNVTSEHPCILSGFAVEFKQNCLVMVEGLDDHTFPTALQDIFYLPTDYGRVLYNDELIFTERLYEEFFPYGGIYITACNISIDDIMSNKKIFLRGNVPIPAMRALDNLYRLMMCSTIQLAAIEKLFPKAQDLISFNIEFGSPLRK